MMFKGKRLLILGGASVHCKVVRAAKKLGIYTIVADYLIDSPAKRIADESLLISILDVDAIVEWCESNPVDAVINYANDPAQRAHQKICERLGLPCFGSAEQVEILTDKSLFKKACEKSGISVIPSYRVEDILEDRISEEVYPLLVKPTDSRGSRGQTICNTKYEVIGAIEVAKREGFSGNILIEKYMGNCDDLQLVYLVADGEPHLVKIEDRYTGSIQNGLDRLCIATVTPSIHMDDYISVIDTKVKSMIKELGLKNAPVFFQGFWLDNDVFMYDPGIRFPGDDFDIAYTRASGVSIPELIIKYLLSGEIDKEECLKIDRYNYSKVIAMVLPCVRKGIITCVQGLEDIRNNPHVAAMTVEYGEGDCVKDFRNFKQRFAEFVLITDDFMQLKEVIDTIFYLLVVTDKNNENMLIEQFSASNLAKYIL